MHLITMPLKPITSSLRLLFQTSVLLALFYNLDLMYQVCGPFTLSPHTRKHLLTPLFLLQILRVFSPFVSRSFSFLLPLPPSSPARHLLHSYSFKYFLLLLLKIMIALVSGEEQRMKFYISSLFLQVWILGIAIAIDCFRKGNIAEVGQILIIDCFYRVAIVYEVTRSFCPNLVLYYSITNLLMVACSQLQTLVSKSQTNKSNLLYTAHDIYRIMVLSFFYFFCFSITQIFSYGWKSIIVFLVVSRWWYLMIKDFNEKELKKSMKWMILTCFSYCFMEILYAYLAY